MIGKDGGEQKPSVCPVLSSLVAPPAHSRLKSRWAKTAQGLGSLRIRCSGSSSAISRRLPESPGALAHWRSYRLGDGTSTTEPLAYEQATCPCNMLTRRSSDPSISVTPATAPGAPSDVSAIPEDVLAVVSWAAPTSDGGSLITAYTVTSDPGGVTATTTSTSVTITGLT